jgi:hypothetical protein
VTTVEIYTTQTPSVLAAVCAPLSAAAIPGYASVVIQAATRAPLPLAHQVQVQSELAVDLLPTTGSNGTFGFRSGMGVWSSKKRTTNGVRGIPPRGRPV